MAPAQPRRHLERLIQPLPCAADADSWSGSLRGLVRRFTSPYYLAGAVISGFLPAPSNADGLQWSFAELRRAAVRCAAFFELHGVKPGTTVLAIIPSSAEWVVMLWVCAFRCYTIVTVDPAVLLPENKKQLQEHLDQLAPTVTVVSTRKDAVAVTECIGERSPFLGLTIEDIDAVSDSASSSWASMADMANYNYSDSISQEPSEDHPDRLAFVIYSSGTSNNKPKGCLRTVREVVHGFDAADAVPPLLPPLSLVNTKSYQAIAPSMLFAAWRTSNAAVLAGGVFCPATTLAALETCRPLALSLMVQMAEQLRGSEAYTTEKVRSVRFVVLIGSAITLETLRRCRRTFPRARVVASFGMTEAACMIGWPGGGPPNSENVPSYWGIAAAGYVLPGAKIKVVNMDGEVVGRNTPGTLHLSGHMVCQGYVGGTSASAFYEEDGVRWMATTDCAVVDNKGLVFVLGRSDSVVEQNGVAITPAMIENALEEEFTNTVSSRSLALSPTQTLLPPVLPPVSRL